MSPKENNKDFNSKAKIEDIKDLSKDSPVVYPKQNDYISNPYASLGSSTVLNRINTNIQEWRQAIKQIERVSIPQFYRLMRIFKDLSEDSEVQATTDLRINNLLSRHFVIKKNGEEEEDEELTAYFKKPWFQKLCREILLSSFYGYSCIKINDIVDDEVTSITSLKRENFNPMTDEILKNYSDTEGTSIETEALKDWYFKVSPYSCEENYLGVYNSVAPYFIQKKDALNSYSDYVNRLGIPNPVLKTNLTDEESVQSAAQYLQNLNNASFALISIDDELEFLEASGASADVFLKLVEECKKAISKLILGTENVGSESNFVGSAMISASAVDLLAMNDIKFVENVFKNQLIPRLVSLGLTFLDGAELCINKDKALTPEDKNLMLDLINTGKYKVPADFLAEKLGMPIEEVEIQEINPQETNEDEQ